MTAPQVFDEQGEALTPDTEGHGAIVLTAPIETIRKVAPRLFESVHVAPHAGVNAKGFLIAFLRWLNANPHQVERLQALRRDLEMDEIGALELVDELIKRSVAEGTPV